MSSTVKKSVFSRWFFGSLLLLTCLALALPASLWSQAASGNIEGYVSDPTGAVIPETEIRLVNTETGQTRTVRSDGTGYYIAAQLPVGTYNITFVREGFADLSRTGVTVQVGDSVKIDATLQLAGVREEVIVTETSPVIEPSRTGQSAVIVADEIRELPVINRNWTDLALLTPGVTFDAEFDAVNTVSMNGQEGAFNNIQVDGADNNNGFFAEGRGRGRSPFQYSQEIVKEFRVLNNAFAAEHGRSAGGVINAVTKSGTNDFHGSVFWYVRDDALSAAPYFTNAVGLPEPDNNRQQFGGTIGGPLVKDKAFFFFSYDQQERKDPVTIVFDDRGRRELGFNPLDFFSSTVPVLSTSNSFLDAVDGSGSTVTLNFTDGISSFEADVIHQAYLNWAFARAYFLGDTSFLDQPVTTAAGQVQSINPFPGREFASQQRTVPRNPDQIVFFPKITWLVNDSNTFGFQWNFQDFEVGPNGIQTNVTSNDSSAADGTLKNRTDSFIFSLTSILTPNVINEARFQYARDDEDVDTNSPGVPDIEIDDFEFGGRSSLPRFVHEDRYQWQDNLTWIKGRHQIKTGLDILWTEDDNFFPGFFSGRYRFRGPGEFIEYARGFIRETVGFTEGRNYFGIDLGDGAGPRSPTFAGFTIRDFSQNFGQALTPLTTVDYGVYVQDSIRLRPDFVLNLGLRYEYQQLQDPILPNPLLPETAEIPEDKNNFAPRIGIAWSPKSNLVVRAGYGLFYLRRSQIDVTNAITGTNAFQFNQFLSGSSAFNAGLANFNSVALDPFNLQASDFDVLDAPTTACPSPPACTDPFASINAFSPDYDSGYTQQSSLEIQWEIVPGTSVSVGGTHTKGTKLPRNRNINVFDEAFGIANARTFTFLDASNNVIRTFDVPDYDAFGTSPNKPNPDFGAINHTESAANSFYNAFLLKFEQRRRRGLTFGLTYTLSKNVTDVTNGVNTGGVFFSDLSDQNNPRADRGLSRLDQRHNFVARMVWEPDFWRDSEGATRWLVDGWSYGFIYTASSGRAITPVVSGDINNDNARTAFGDGDRVPFLARGSFTIQGRNNFNLSVYKGFRFGEGKSLQFRFQAFNLFNRPTFTRFDDVMFDVSGTTATLNESFLQPEGFALRSRDIQLGLVFRF